ncbi:hypothetical protein LJR118_002145 [Acidovorax sp. LjRoot118]|uniref:hypothetical protein n=1 Tax=Acidovorax sp. LjRoot118 TaxID=3342256 RepID=UPI003ED044C9
MTKASTTRKAPASRHGLASISNAAAAQAAAAESSTVVPLNVTVKAAPANADEVLRYAALGIETQSGTLDSISLQGGSPTRSMASAIAAFNALEGTALTERQGWALLQALNMARAANTARSGDFSSQHYMNAAAFAALGHEAADPSR